MKKGTRKTPNKSQLIREYAGNNPSARPAEIVKHFAAQGITVSAAHISQALKAKGNGKKAASKRGRPAKQANAAPGIGLESLLEVAMAFVKHAGSIDRAIETLTVLKKIS